MQCCVSALCMVKAVWMAPSDALWRLFCRSRATLLPTTHTPSGRLVRGVCSATVWQQWWRHLPGPKGLGRRRVVCCLHPKRGLTRPSACVIVQRRVGTAFSLLSCWQCHASCATVRGARRRPLLPMGGRPCVEWRQRDDNGLCMTDSGAWWQPQRPHTLDSLSFVVAG